MKLISFIFIFLAVAALSPDGQWFQNFLLAGILVQLWHMEHSNNG